MLIVYIPKCMPQKSLSFNCQKFLDLQPYKYSSNTRKIDFYCKYWKNKSQVLTKTVVTFEYNTVRTLNLYHYARHELSNGLLGKLFHLSSSQTNMKSMDCI